MGAGTDETDRRLMMTVGLVVVLGVMSVGWALWRILATGEIADSPWERIGCVTAALAVTNLVTLQVRIKSNHHYLGMEEVVLLFGLALLPGPWFVMATATGVAIARVIRQAPLMKLLFNVSKFTCLASCAVAAAAAFHVLGPFAANSRTLPGIVAAAVTNPIVAELLTIPVIAFATATPARQMFRTNFDVRVGGIVVRLALTVIALFAIPKQIVFVIVAPLVLAAIQFISSNRLRERAERAAWQKLAQTTDELNEVDLDIVLLSAVKRAAELFSADQVDVRIAVSALRDRLVLGDAATIRYDGPPKLAPPASAHPISTPLVGHDGATVGELRLLFEDKKIGLTE